MKIGILGGGQLGYMFLQNAIQYPAEIHVLDPSDDAPCKPHAHVFVKGDFKDYQTVVDFGKDLDAIGIEIEHVNADALKTLKKMGKRVVPDPESLEIIQDKGLQKQFYQKNNIPTAPFVSEEEFKSLSEEELTYPTFQKTRKGGYDGKGVQLIKEKSEYINRLKGLSIFEQPANVDKELAVVVVYDGKDNLKSYPVVELVFNEQYNLLDYLLMPADLKESVAEKAIKISEQTIKALGSAGIFAVELFLNKDGSMWVNETACRVHNSGHSTIESAYSSQFDQMLRLLMGLPLGSTAVHTISAMTNLIGAEGEIGDSKINNIKEVLKIQGVYLHWYAKKETRPGRKMGHITILNNNLAELKSTVSKINTTVTVTAKK